MAECVLKVKGKNNKGSRKKAIMNVGPSGKRGYSGRVAPSSDADKMKSRGGCVQDRVQSKGRLVGPSVVLIPRNYGSQRNKEIEASSTASSHRRTDVLLPPLTSRILV